MKKIVLALLAICLMACDEDSAPFEAVDGMSSASNREHIYVMESSCSIIVVPVNSSAIHRRSSSSKLPN